jgi:hypothetical protein
LQECGRLPIFLVVSRYRDFQAQDNKFLINKVKSDRTSRGLQRARRSNHETGLTIVHVSILTARLNSRLETLACRSNLIDSSIYRDAINRRTSESWSHGTWSPLFNGHSGSACSTHLESSSEQNCFPLVRGKHWKRESLWTVKKAASPTLPSKQDGFNRQCRTWSLTGNSRRRRISFCKRAFVNDTEEGSQS